MSGPITVTDTYSDGVLAALNTLAAGGSLRFFTDSLGGTLSMSVALHASAPFTDEGTPLQYQYNRDSGVFAGLKPTLQANNAPVVWGLYKADGTTLIWSGTVGAVGDGDAFEFDNMTDANWVSGQPMPGSGFGTTEPVFNYTNA